jgi:hypothetical protein
MTPDPQLFSTVPDAETILQAMEKLYSKTCTLTDMAPGITDVSGNQQWGVNIPGIPTSVNCGKLIAAQNASAGGPTRGSWQIGPNGQPYWQGEVAPGPVGTNLVSIPTNPLQPNLSEYPISAMQRVASFTYESYQQEFGAAPPWDPTRGYEQDWFDSTADPSPGSGYQFKTIMLVNGVPAMPTKLITGGQASVVNIPPPQDKSNLPKLNAPMRDLLSNEALALVADVPLPGIVSIMVVRTDLQSNLPAQYTQGDKAILARLDAWLFKQLA